MSIVTQPMRLLCNQVGLSNILSDCVQDYCKLIRQFHWKLVLWLAYQSEERINL